MTTKSNPVTYHKHMALLRAHSDQEFLEELSRLEDAGYRVAMIGKDVRFEGTGTVALMLKPEPKAEGPETVFEFEDVPETMAVRPEAPYDPAIA